MRLVFGLVLIAGLGMAGFAVYMAQNYIGVYEDALAQEREKAEQAVPTQEIYVATRAIAYGEQLTPEDVTLVPWPMNTLPEAYFDAANPILKEGDLPRVVVRQLEKNEAFMPVKVSEPGGDAGIASRLSRGERAFAIKVDVASGVSGFLRPNDRVDVYWTGRIPGNNPNLPQGDVTKLIETGVRLIAIDQMANSDTVDATIARTVTVAATPQQVAGLAQAQSTGRLSLSLMGFNDDTVAVAIEVDQLALLGLQKEEEAAPSLKPCFRVERRGVEIKEIQVPCQKK